MYLAIKPVGHDVDGAAANAPTGIHIIIKINTNFITDAFYIKLENAAVRKDSELANEYAQSYAQSLEQVLADPYEPLYNQ